MKVKNIYMKNEKYRIIIIDEAQERIILALMGVRSFIKNLY